MTVESSFNYPSDLNASLPASGDARSEGDDHIRGIKSVLKTTLPNVNAAITASDEELNYSVGVTSAIQTQLNALASVTQNTKNQAYTLVIGDANKQIYKSDTSAYAWTVPPNSSVAFPIGTTVSMINNGSAGAITITQGSGVTFRLAGTTSTGNRTLAARGLATVIKVGTDEWYVTGAGVT